MAGAAPIAVAIVPPTNVIRPSLSFEIPLTMYSRPTTKKQANATIINNEGPRSVRELIVKDQNRITDPSSLVSRKAQTTGETIKGFHTRFSRIIRIS
jgi:hypothetical protein